MNEVSVDERCLDFGSTTQFFIQKGPTTMACNAIATLSAQVPLKATLPLAEAALKTTFGDSIQIHIYAQANPPLLTADILFENSHFHLLYKSTTGTFTLENFNSSDYRSDQETEQLTQIQQKLAAQVRSAFSQVAAAALAKSAAGSRGRIQNAQRTSNATIFTLKV